MTQTAIVVLRRDYLEICQGNFCAAKLINYFLGWHKWKMQVHRTPWIYRKQEEIKQDLMGEYSINIIRQATEFLENLGIILRRKNPGNLQDKTWQYKLNLEYLEELLKRRSSNFESSTLKNEPSALESEEYIYSSDTNNSSFISDPPPEKIDETRGEVGQEEPPSYQSDRQQEITEYKINQEVKEIYSNPPVSIYEEKSFAAGESSKKLNNRTNQNPQVKYIWEVAPGRPYPAFLQWWADYFYKPQGNHWEKNAEGFAYSEFYKNPQKTEFVIYPKFLEYIHTATENANQAHAAGITTALPSCLLPRIEATEENVMALMGRVEALVQKGIRVMLPSHTPSSPIEQFTSEIKDVKVQPLPQLLPPELAPGEKQGEAIKAEWREWEKKILASKVEVEAEQEEFNSINWDRVAEDIDEWQRKILADVAAWEDNSILERDFWLDED